MNLFSLPINPAPNGAEIIQFYGYDGLKLRAARWKPTRGPVRGTMCLFPGRGETIEKYFEVIADLRRRGFAVAIMDWRGQGGSGRKLSNPRKGHVMAFTEYDRDLARFMADVVQPALPAPYIAMGHSLGGNILLRNAQDESSPFARMILVSPMIEIHQNLLTTTTAKARAYTESACAAGFATSYVRGGNDTPEEMKPFEETVLTYDPVRYSRNRAIVEQAPDLAIGSATIGWLRAALRSCSLLQRPAYPKLVTVPMLVFAAANDRVVSAKAIETFAVQLKVGGHILMPGSRHEILQESDLVRERFWAAFDAYMGVDIPVSLPVEQSYDASDERAYA
jgi:lysophospholipase